MRKYLLSMIYFIIICLKFDVYCISSKDGQHLTKVVDQSQQFVQLCLTKTIKNYYKEIQLQQDDKSQISLESLKNEQQIARSCYKYIPDCNNLPSVEQVLLIIRHGETGQSVFINSDCSSNPISPIGEKHLAEYKEILQKLFYIVGFYPVTLRNVWSAKAISNKLIQHPPIKELELGNYENQKKKDILNDRIFLKTLDELGTLSGCTQSTAHSLIEFAEAIRYILNYKINKSNISKVCPSNIDNILKICVANSAIMGLVLYTIIKEFDSNVEYKNVIPNNLDFMCVSLTDDNLIRVYDLEQTKCIFQNTNISYHLFPSATKSGDINKSLQINGKSILMSLK